MYNPLKIILKKTIGQYVLVVYHRKDVIAVSERFSSREALEKTLEILQNKRFTIDTYSDKINRSRFRVRALNDEILLVSEGYLTTEECVLDVTLIERYVSTAEVEDMI